MAFYFWKTNLLHKYFKKIKENRRNLKMAVALEVTSRKIVFRVIKAYAYRGQRTIELIERFKYVQDKKKIFKYFASWKQFCRRSACSYERLKAYQTQKSQYLLKYCYDILKLGFKKRMLKNIMAERVFKGKIFRALRDVTDEGKEFRDKEYCLNEYLYFKKSSFFVNRFISFYDDIVEFQRFAVK